MSVPIRNKKGWNNTLKVPGIEDIQGSYFFNSSMELILVNSFPLNHSSLSKMVTLAVSYTHLNEVNLTHKIRSVTTLRHGVDYWEFFLYPTFFSKTLQQSPPPLSHYVLSRQYLLSGFRLILPLTLPDSTSHHFIFRAHSLAVADT